jgi:signal transduction histidine kinase
LNGEPHLLNITRDITERVEMKLAMQEYNARLETEVAQRTHQLGLIQEKLLRQERLATLGQVAGSVAHELRNPLGVISNAVYFLNLITPQTEPRVQEYLTIIEQETRYAEKVVSDLLDQSRIKLPDRSQISVTELVQQALDRNPLSPHIRLTLDISAELPPVYVDPVQIVQVLGNLLSNAYQAMPDGGGLTIAARQNGQEVAIKVIDQGEGIAAEYMPRMFEPLFTTKQKGIGLGLSLSKNLVESNDGRIDVFSQTGQGSTFVVFLPVVGSIQEKKPYE